MSTSTATLGRPARSRRLSLAVTPELQERMQLESALDAVRRARAETWLRRAEQWEWAAPRPGDFVGRATEADIEARAARCHQLATACRAHAAILEGAHRPGEPLPKWIGRALDLAAGTDLTSVPGGDPWH